MKRIEFCALWADKWIGHSGYTARCLFLFPIPFSPHSHIFRFPDSFLALQVEQGINTAKVRGSTPTRYPSSVCTHGIEDALNGSVTTYYFEHVPV